MAGTSSLLISTIVVLSLLLIFSLLAIVVLYRQVKSKSIFANENRDLTVMLEKQEALNSDQKRRIEDLELWARIVKQSPNGIMVMDSDGNVLDVNKGFAQMYEYSYSEFVAARGSNYRKTSFSREVLERIDKVVNHKTPVRYEALNITKSGKQLWTQTALVPILDHKGEFDGMVTIDTDIHSRIVVGDALISKMEGINSTIDSISHHFKLLANEAKSLFETINETNELLDKTVMLIHFIREISDGLKILGINASIEAHLAGANGRGFRVVANEIVDISNKGLSSVTQITELLSQISEKQSELLQSKKDSSAALQEHHQQMKQLKKEIQEVEGAISELKTLS